MLFFITSFAIFCCYLFQVFCCSLLFFAATIYLLFIAILLAGYYYLLLFYLLVTANITNYFLLLFVTLFRYCFLLIFCSYFFGFTCSQLFLLFPAAHCLRFIYMLFVAVLLANYCYLLPVVCYCSTYQLLLVLPLESNFVVDVFGFIGICCNEDQLEVFLVYLKSLCYFIVTIYKAYCFTFFLGAGTQ